jgi:DedD protein
MPVSTAAPSPGSSVVQVAAMSHQEDADVVAVDLKRRGYAVAIRREPQDKLFHVQIGPFSTKKEADATRVRLQTDGYNNAIVK